MSRNERINKRTFLTALLCARQGWYTQQEHLEVDESLSESDRLRRWMGQEVGRRARQLFNSGRLIDDPTFRSAVETTRNALKHPDTSALFEAALVAGPLAARADILARDGRGWHLIEVKSSINESAEQLQDLAYTVMVARGAGVPVTRASLMLLSPDWRVGAPVRRQFITQDRTVEAEELVRLFVEEAELLGPALLSATPPDAEFSWSCRDCPFFADCMGGEVHTPIFQLPGLRQRRFEQLTARGARNLQEVPDDFPLSTRQRQTLRTLLHQEIHFDWAALDRLDDIRWPAAFLDFEAIAPAIPVYPDTAPFETIPTQYSIHLCRAPGQVLHHRVHLADPRHDGRRELAEKLLCDLRDAESILSYSPYEKTVTSLLAARFPELEAPIRALQDRFFDLLPVVREGLNHPDFRGSWSIKAVLPVFAPGLDYGDLSIANGADAAAVFTLMALGEIPAERFPERRAALLEYCGRDTLAMVRLQAGLHDIRMKRKSGPA